MLKPLQKMFGMFGASSGASAEAVKTENWHPAKKRAFDEQIGQYCPAYNALTTVFSMTNNELFSELQTGVGTNVEYRFTIKPIVEQLWNVDGPVQGRDVQSLIKYLKSRNHPQKGDVYAWYVKSFKIHT